MFTPTQTFDYTPQIQIPGNNPALMVDVLLCIYYLPRAGN